ncbi:hypothetical protein [Kitasatospora sp. NPDC088134]|uniref:hypothetical protein n=1 Tax=Kitasatospora sp. NPDC088134 TaxID=3364071 RepID=UPI00381BA2F0
MDVHVTVLGPEPVMSAIALDAAHRRLHPDRTVTYGVSEPFGTDPGHVWCCCRVPEPARSTMIAVHEAGHAVIGVALGLTLDNLSIGGRTELEGGWADSGGAGFKAEGEAQSMGAAMIAGHLAEQQWAHRHGYTHPELDRCRTYFGAAGDWAVIEHIRDHGLLVDSDRAGADVRRLLDQPPFQGAVTAVAAMLIEHGSGTHDQVARILDDHHVTTPQIWQPSQAELIAHQRTWQPPGPRRTGGAMPGGTVPQDQARPGTGSPAAPGPAQVHATARSAAVDGDGPTGRADGTGPAPPDTRGTPAA